MNIDSIINILLIIFGLLSIIKFRYFGARAIEQRKLLNKFLPFPNRSDDFGETAILFTQLMFLFMGILFVSVGLTKIFK